MTSRCLTVVSVVADTIDVGTFGEPDSILLDTYATVTMTDGTLTIIRRMPVFECPRIGTQYSGHFDPTGSDDTP
jgi:hypothetical protein